MALVTPTFAAGDHNTFDVGSIRDILEQIMVPHTEAMAMLRILFANKQTGPLNPKEEFEIPIKTKNYSPSISRKNDKYPLDDIDNIVSEKWGVVKMKTGAGTNDDDVAHFSNVGSLALFNHIDIKVESMHEGFTKVLNFLPFYDWDGTTDIVGEEIDVSSLLSNQSLPPEDLKLKEVSSISDLPYSLPMAARKTVTGHTFGNIPTTPTTNLYWQPVVTDASGATVTRNTTAYDADSNPQTDIVTSITDPVPLDQSELRTHLSKMQEGKQYALLAPCGRDLYGQLRDIITSMNIRDHQSPIADLGIRSAITWDEYNVTFFHDPKMDALWPTTIWFFDPLAYYMKTDVMFDPTGGTGFYPWDRISGTTNWGTMIRMIYQFITSDRRGVGAMHGYTSDS